MTGGRERAVLLGVVALALAAVGVQGWSLWVRLGESAMPMAASASVAGYVATAAETDLAGTMAFAPFGRAEGVAVAEAPAPAEAPVDLTLLGITLSPDAASSRAIIGLADGTAHSFGIGQSLPSGATLAAVQTDHVVIRSGDTEAALRFPTDPAPADAVAGAAPADGPDLVNLIPTPTAAPAPASATASVSAPASQALLTGIKLAMNHDPAGYVAGLGLTPDAGGYRVGAGLDAGLQQAGLQPGDLVTAVNGMAPGDPARDAAILNTVAAAGTAVLRVIRDGQTLTLTVPLE